MILSHVASFPTTKKSINSAVKTAITPKIEPKNAPAIGPKNWNNVKNWFSAPIKGEKFIFCAKNAKTINKAIKTNLFFVNIFLKSIKITKECYNQGIFISF